MAITSNVTLKKANQQHEQTKAAQQAYSQPQQPQQNANRTNPAYGAGSGFEDTFFSVSGTLGSEYITSIIEGMKVVFDSQAASLRPKINIIEKESFQIAHSCIIISASNGNDVTYFTTILEATGEKPKTASEVFKEIQMVMNPMGNKDYTPDLWTTDDDFDGELEDIIVSVLKQEYGAGKDFISVDGLVIPHIHSDNKIIGARVGAIAFKAVHIELKLMESDLDLNIQKAINELGRGARMEIEANLLKQTSTNDVDMPVRTDWQVQTVLTKNVQGVQSPHAKGGKKVITKSSGFVDTIAQIIKVPNPGGFGVTEMTRFHPMIIIDSVAGQEPTYGYTLLSIIASLAMIDESVLMKTLLPKDKSDMNDVGYLNLLANVTNEQSGQVTPIDFTSGALSLEESVAMLKQMYTLRPLLYMDIETFGPQTHYTSIISAAATGNLEAASALIESAVKLTGGIFPADFKPANVFRHDGVVVPLGTWSDNNGDRDIRDIDAAFIMKHTGDVNLVQRWILSQFSANVGNIDSYSTKVDIINHIIPNASITGKALRVGFSDDFIAMLHNSAERAGFTPGLVADVIYTENNDLTMISDFLGDAGISGVGFQRTNSFNSKYAPNFNMFNGGGRRFM